VTEARVEITVTRPTPGQIGAWTALWAKLLAPVKSQCPAMDYTSATKGQNSNTASELAESGVDG
jgi:hypothetical protein